MFKLLTWFSCLIVISLNGISQNLHKTELPDVSILPGAYRINEYKELLADKRVGLVINQTSEINGILLPDTLIALGIQVVKIFSPEHGFRGAEDAGAIISNGRDSKTNLPIISLYGKNKKPTQQQLQDIDILVYDLQDVGVRFYTYISTLQYVLEACAEFKKEVLVLDRPNPLGGRIDGPVLKKEHTSFVGMQPIPVVYGMTPGEYAKMLIGENWITTPDLTLNIIPCLGYRYSSRYQLPVAPSPNLKNMSSVYLYPSLCFFEGTEISLGRGTPFSFQQYGHPLLKNHSDTFTPRSLPGATNPPLKDKLCYGKLITTDPSEAILLTEEGINLSWLITAYKNFPKDKSFFNNFFEKLAGTSELRKQIESGLSAEEIKRSWQKNLDGFKLIRSKYLLYEE